MEIHVPGTKRFIPKGFEFGTALSQLIWCIVYFPTKTVLKIDTFHADGELANLGTYLTLG